MIIYSINPEANKKLCELFNVGCDPNYEPEIIEVYSTNVRIVIPGSDRTGTKHSEETKQIIREKRKSQVITTETRQKKSISMKGKNVGKKRSLKEINDHADKISLYWIVTNPEGEVFKIKNMKKFCRENNLNSGHMFQVAKGNKNHYKKWKCIKSI